jgi:hypothetical protein
MLKAQMKDSKNTQVLDMSPQNLARHVQEQKNDLLNMSGITIQRKMWLRFTAGKKTLAVLDPLIELVRVPFSEVKFVAERLSSRHEFLKT